MLKKVTVCVLILLMQACGPLLAQKPAPAEEESVSPGILQTLAERAREAKAKVQGVGVFMLDFADAYYEEHIKPVTDPYVEWTSNATDPLWERLQNAYNKYMPFKWDRSS